MNNNMLSTSKAAIEAIHLENTRQSEITPESVNLECHVYLHRVSEEEMNNMIECEPTDSDQASTSSRVSKKKSSRKQNQTFVIHPDAPKFVDCSLVKINKKEKPVYDVAFNHFLGPNQPNVFAAVSTNRVFVLESLSNGRIKQLQCFEDPDVEEIFYVCCWSYDDVARKSMLIVGGSRGIIRVLYPEDETCEKHFVRHGSDIYDLKVAPKMKFLLVSASRDYSFRLWNLQTNVCIAAYHQVDAHRDGVISVDFNYDGSLLASGGMDHKIAIWDLKSEEVQKAIEASKRHDPSKGASFKTLYHPFAKFTTRKLHNDYVDCVKWYGDFIISKSCQSYKILCWSPGSFSDPKEIGNDNFITRKVLSTLDLPDSDLWYSRFALSPCQTLLACGNDNGMLKIWNLGHDDPDNLPEQIITEPRRTSLVQSTSFSRCGQTLVVCCADGTIWRYDTTKQ